MITSKKLSLLFSFLCGGLILSLIIIKAKNASFTHDESFSYLNYLSQSFMEILSYANWYTNNHILNSLGMKYSEILFGNSELALRLPNIILFIFYATFSYQLFKKTNSLIAISFFVILTTNNALVDFFGLARGYGLSMGFMMTALYFYIKLIKTSHYKFVILFHLCCLLAVLSNFTLINFYIGSILFYYLTDFIKQKIIHQNQFNFHKNHKLNLFMLIFSITVLYEPIRRVIMYNKMDFGGKSSFFNDTVYSITNDILYHSNLTNNSILLFACLFSSLVILLFSFIIYKFIKKEWSFFYENYNLVFSTCILIFISIASYILHLVFKTDYLAGRFALFLIPLFFLMLGLSINFFSKKSYKIHFQLISLSLAILSLLNFYTNFNSYVYNEWAYDANTKTAMQKIASDYHSRTLKDSISMGVSWEFEPSVNFYRKKYNCKLLKQIKRYNLKGNNTYYYGYLYDITLDSLHVKHHINSTQYDVYTNTVLLTTK